MTPDRELGSEEPKTARERAAVENLDRSTRYDHIAMQALQNAVTLANSVATNGAALSNLVNNNSAALANRTNQNRETFDANEFYDHKRDEDYTDERMNRANSQAVTTEAALDDILVKGLASKLAGTSPGSDEEAAIVSAIRVCRRKAA